MFCHSVAQPERLTFVPFSMQVDKFGLAISTVWLAESFAVMIFSRTMETFSNFDAKPETRAIFKVRVSYSAFFIPLSFSIRMIRFFC
jgi:hypothetical protein